MLTFVTFMLCAATFSNSYVKWRLCYVMLRFVAVPSDLVYDLSRAKDHNYVEDNKIVRTFKKL